MLNYGCIVDIDMRKLYFRIINFNADSLKTKIDRDRMGLYWIPVRQHHLHIQSDVVGGKRYSQWKDIKI